MGIRTWDPVSKQKPRENQMPVHGSNYLLQGHACGGVGVKRPARERRKPFYLLTQLSFEDVSVVGLLEKVAIHLSGRADPSEGETVIKCVWLQDFKNSL